MNALQSLLRRFNAPVKPLPTGMYALHAGADTGAPYRLHLRLQPNGDGILIVNASTVLHLNQTAAEYAYHLIQQTPAEEVGRQVAARYKVLPEVAKQDYTALRDRILALVGTEDLDPVSFLDFERLDPYATPLSAPLRLDCALTYRTSAGGHDPRIAPFQRVKRELSNEEWQRVLEAAWNAGIPHIVFTGGEPTLRPDLPDLLQFAENQGQVTSLLTDGLRLAEPTYLHRLLAAGLDHVMVVLDEDEDQSWEALRDCLAEDLAVTAHVTISGRNQDRAAEVLDRMAGMGVRAVSLSAAGPEFAGQLQALRDRAATRQISVLWDLPVPFSEANPLAVELGEETPHGAGRAWLYVEPDGDVTGQQGSEQVLGNLLEQPWQAIWAQTQRPA